MVEIKTFSGNLNQDDSIYRLPPNDYIDALNITKNAIEGSNDSVVSPRIANRLGSSTFTFPTGNRKTIGGLQNTLRNTVIQLDYNDTGYHQVLEFNMTTRSYQKLLTNITDTGGIDILGFTLNDKINNIAIYNRDEGDLLFFLDSLGRPTQMDIEKFRSSVYTPVTREILDIAKCPPQTPPTCFYSNDTTSRTNSFLNKLFRFKYRYVYDDFTKSTFSPIGQVPLPDNILSDTFTSVITNNNVINISLPIIGVGLNVKAIELTVSYVDKTNVWSDFELVQTIKRTSFNSDLTTPVAVSFYNDSTYPTIDINESILLFDYVPPYAKAMAMVNGNTLVFAAIREGGNNDVVFDVQTNILTYQPAGGAIGDFTITLTVISSTNWNILVAGTPVIGSIIVLKGLRVSTGSTDTIAIVNVITTNTSDIVNSIVSQVNSYGRGLASSANSSVSLNFYSYNVTHKNMAVSATYPSVTTASDSVPTFLWSTKRRLGIQYYNSKGFTIGVQFSTLISFPAYSEPLSPTSYIPALPYIQVSINNQPPIDAVSYQFLLTKEATVPFFWHTIDVKYSEADYLYFDVSNIALNATKNPLNSLVLNYQFQQGDRMRLVRRMSDNLVFDDTYDALVQGEVTNPVISGSPVTGTFIKIKNISPFTAVDYSSKNFVINIYRQGQQSASADNETYFEFGYQFGIGDAGLPTRYHKGNSSDQDLVNSYPAISNLYNGDSYFRSRRVYINDLGLTSGLATFFVQDRNFVDFYISAVSSVDGRPSIIDPNARNAYYSTLVRFSKFYEANTNINGLNRFYPANFDEYDYSFGDILRLIVRDRIMRVFQRDKLGQVPIYNQISRNANGTQLLVVTDKLLNPINYYVGNIGIGTCPESLASNRFADYGCDNIRGIVWRLSNDGVEPLSTLYKMNSWANDNIPLRINNFKINGAFDPRLNQYVIALDAVPCIPVSIPAFSLNDATIGVLFNQSIPVTGSLNILLSNITVPSWMTISIVGNIITFSGTPLSLGTGEQVNFTISNDCGTISSINTINVINVPCTAVGISGSPVLPNGKVGIAYYYSLSLTGDTPFVLSATITKPSWMNISISGSLVIFMGTPDTSGTSIPISITITNCTSGSIGFSNSIDIAATGSVTTNCISLYHESDTGGKSVYIYAKSSIPVTANVVVLINLYTTTGSFYELSVTIPFAGNKSNKVKVNYTSGSPTEHFASMTVDSIIPSSDANYNYINC